ncbi:uncharacterized protein A1O5_02879 [Cladophialophora psammophila CBS 110553]|uniref:Uncharacterized protein n=1 Tax=Cladophialophora psammophila CBS 110553 TaxID=1182543 RepID=W9X301_9EURO|nr:uncharacterized protein A1O5_02879 [Cladophialophora psammophila CBS 110553]EXJ74583.1 hypothetical protein A1O5_02879 [Cladophialophora psammophila CBS 110553]
MYFHLQELSPINLRAHATYGFYFQIVLPPASAFAKSEKAWNDPASKDPNNQGSLLRLVFKSLSPSGVCPELDWAYEDAQFARQPGDDLVDAAVENDSVYYLRLGPGQSEGVEKHVTEAEKDIIGAMTLLRLRQYLAEGHSLVSGFRCYWQTPRFQKDDVSVSWALASLPSRRGPAGKWGGNMVLVVGFDDDKKRILYQKSWGASDSVAGTLE